MSIGCRTTLEAKATGSRAPKTRDCSQGQRIDIQNGDFSIVQSCLSRENLVVGDGISEETHWVFDLHDEDIGSCYPETASIEMRLRPTGHLMTEELRVEGSFAMGLEAIQSMSVGEEQKLVVDPILIFFALYGVVIFASSANATAPEHGDAAVIVYVKNLVLILVIINLLTSKESLHKSVWVLILSGAFLGTISAYQVFSGLYDADFGGFGRVKYAHIVGSTFEARIAGPLSDPPGRVPASGGTARCGPGSNRRREATPRCGSGCR